MKIFISYRREDAESALSSVIPELRKAFGAENITLDILSIPAGENVPEYISRAICSSDVVLVLIGERWLDASQDGVRRLDDPSDFVRMEIETAQNSKIQIVPVLLGGARMPKEHELPQAINQLAVRNGVQVRWGRDFERDIEELITSLKAIGQVKEQIDVKDIKRKRGRARMIALTSVAILILASLLSVAYKLRYRINGGVKNAGAQETPARQTRSKDVIESIKQGEQDLLNRLNSGTEKALASAGLYKDQIKLLWRPMRPRVRHRDEDLLFNCGIKYRILRRGEQGPFQEVGHKVDDAWNMTEVVSFADRDKSLIPGQVYHYQITWQFHFRTEDEEKDTKFGRLVFEGTYGHESPRIHTAFDHDITGFVSRYAPTGSE
jgi:hypothetical protein